MKQRFRSPIDFARFAIHRDGKTHRIRVACLVKPYMIRKIKGFRSRMCSDGKKRQRSCNVGKVKEFESSIRLKRKESKEILTLGWSG
jgi:hypothetical protein